LEDVLVKKVVGLPEQEVVQVGDEIEQELILFAADMNMSVSASVLRSKIESRAGFRVN